MALAVVVVVVIIADQAEPRKDMYPVGKLLKHFRSTTTDCGHP